MISPIPDYQTLRLLHLKIVAKLGAIKMGTLTQLLSSVFKLAEEEWRVLLSGGKQTIIQNRVEWLCTYLKKDGLLQSFQRGVIEITERGKEMVEELKTVDYVVVNPPFNNKH